VTTNANPMHTAGIHCQKSMPQSTTPAKAAQARVTPRGDSWAG
jgi:hypothetical protein